MPNPHESTAEGTHHLERPGSDDLHEALEQLRISEERHRLIAEHANDVVWTMALDGTITSLSSAISQVRGLTPQQAMAQPLEDIHTPSSQQQAIAYLQQLHAALARGDAPPTFRGELEYYHRDGSIVWAEVQVLPHQAPDGTVIELLGVSRDISERKRHELELEAARQRAEAANRELADRIAQLEDFAGITAHDLQGPLATIRMLLEQADTAEDGRQPSTRDLVRRASAQADRAAATVTALLELAGASQRSLTMELVDLGEVVDGVIDSLGAALTDQQARIERQALPPVHGDRALLHLLFQNLLGNALRCQRPDRPLRVCVSATAEDARCTVTVRDNGQGVAPEDLERIFEAYTRGRESSDDGGLGIGLATCRRIAERHGGTIEAQASVEGSCFVVVLPDPEPGMVG